MSRLSEISFEPLEPYDGKLSCTVLRGERGSNAPFPLYERKSRCIMKNNEVYHLCIIDV